MYETVTGPNTLAEIQQVLDTLWADHDVPDRARMSMELAVSEIVANIIEHSGGGKPVRLRMRARVGSNAVEVIFTDDGHPAPVDLANLSMPPETAERGRGLAIAHRVLDLLSYRRDSEGNHWTLMLRI